MLRLVTKMSLTTGADWPSGSETDILPIIDKNMRNLLIFLLVTFVASACYEDHSEVIPGQDFIPDDILEKIRENGQPIFEGLNPPDVSGKYRISPLDLISSNFPDNRAPERFADEIVEFTAYNEKELTLKVSLEGARSTGEGFGSFISGSGQNFTIYVRIDRTRDNGLSTIETRLYSGTLEENGISNLYTSVFMVNDGGDPENDLIENGQGRLFRDENGFSEKIP